MRNTFIAPKYGLSGANERDARTCACVLGHWGNWVPRNDKTARWYHNTACKVLSAQAHALDPVGEVAFDTSTSTNGACL